MAEKQTSKISESAADVVRGVAENLERRAHEIFKDTDRYEEWCVLVNAADDLRTAIGVPRGKLK